MSEGPTSLRRVPAESDTTPALFRHLPELSGRLPWVPLGRFPTPVARVEVPGVGTVLVKRDDVCADGYAGNKVRKLEFLLAAATAAGAGRLITAGATGSHHALATTWHGRRLGFAVSLVLFPQALTDHVRDILLLDHALGAELRWVRRMEAVPYGVWRARVAHRREQPIVIPPGGSNATGTLGYVSAAFELADQIRAGVLPQPSRVHVAAGTLGTTAGLALGFAWAGLDVPIVATRITSRIVTNERVLESLIRGTTALLRGAGADPPAPAAALRLVELRHDQIGRGYGAATDAGVAATALFGRHALKLDATYTAKAAAALIAAGPADPPPLFWQTLSAVEPAAPETDTPLPEPFASYLAGGNDA